MALKMGPSCGISPQWATMKPSRHLGALKRRVTCNCGPRGTVSCGFQVSKEQLEEERLESEGRRLQEEMP